MKKNLAQQYTDGIAETFANSLGEMNRSSVDDFKRAIGLILGKKERHAIDLGCGPGDMISHLHSLGHKCMGIDSSSDMVALARKNSHARIIHGDFSKTLLKPNEVDLVISKWAMQTAEHIEPIYREVVRIIRKGGHFVFLVVHPFRQFIEKKNPQADYFKKEIVHSEIFNREITVQEPSHTMAEYLSDYFLSHFTVCSIREAAEFPAAERIGEWNYPTYLIITAQKK